MAKIPDWRRDSRWRELRALEERTRAIHWSADLLELLIEELFVGDDFERLLGNPRDLPPGRYPQAVAIALALRHSWREDDLHLFVGQILQSRRARAPRRRHPATAADARKQRRR